MKQTLTWVGFVAGAAALILQLAITLPARLDKGDSLVGGLVFYFSFFTILTNIGVVLVYASLLSASSYAWLPGFAGYRMRGAMVVSIAVVHIVYVTLLAHLSNPQGLFLLCDVLLHYVTPALFVLWWLVAGADGRTRWSDISWWMLYPLAYLAYVLARAPFAGEVPYPFLDLTKNSVGSVAVSTLGVTAVFLVLSVVAVLADNGIARIRAPRHVG